MNIQQALQYGISLLSPSSESPALDTQILLSHVLQCNSAHLIAWPEKNLELQQETQYQQLIQQRLKGLPVAHLIGKREFWSLDFKVDDSTLIPRPETETLVEFILQKFNHKKHLKLLDIGTGSGAIAISLAKEKPEWKVFASEISEAALKLAKSNSKQHQTHNLVLIHSNWFDAITEHDFDIIVSNPPYIANNDPHLSQGDVRFEPLSALTSGATGMNAIEHLCSQAKRRLSKNGYLIVEHGYNQAQQVAACFTENGYKKIEQKKDLAGNPRMTAGQIVAKNNEQ